jgi:prepilin-type N-terminal cleavage/methylation domain-containing protein
MEKSVSSARRDCGGFTLIEVMITMFFLSFIIQGLAMVQIHAQRSGIHARRITTANILAERALEKYRNTDFDNLPLHDAEQNCYDVHMAFVTCGGARDYFTETTTITADTPLANVTEVDVTVGWQEDWKWQGLVGDGEVQQAKVVSYLSRY